jgi:hypothetical protein
MGYRSFDGVKCFVRKSNRVEVVAYEQVGESPVLYWAGRQPLLVSLAKEASTSLSETDHCGNYKYTKNITIRSLACFRPLSDLVVDAVRAYNGRVASRKSRHYVQRVIGSAQDQGVQLGGGQKGQSVEINSACIISHADGELSQDSKSGFYGLVETPELKRMDRRCGWWMESRVWFEDLDMPWRDGWLLHGKPGCGKTSLVRAIARKYDLPVYAVVSSTMTNRDLASVYQDASQNSPSIVLLEDIDAVFNGRESVGKLTFEAMLEQLDGVEATHGVITVLTTNHRDRLDEALIREGRMNEHVEVLPMGNKDKDRLVEMVLGDGEFIDHSGLSTPAQVRAECLRLRSGPDVAISRTRLGALRVFER